MREQNVRKIARHTHPRPKSFLRSLKRVEQKKRKKKIIQKSMNLLTVKWRLLLYTRVPTCATLRTILHVKFSIMLYTRVLNQQKKRTFESTLMPSLWYVKICIPRTHASLTYLDFCMYMRTQNDLMKLSALLQ